MSPRRKPGNPMRYRGFYCDNDLYKEMRKCAEIADESDSEYIRKAIEMRNMQYELDKSIGEYNVKSDVDKYAAKIKNQRNEEDSQKRQQEVQTFFKK